MNAVVVCMNLYQKRLTSFGQNILFALLFRPHKHKQKLVHWKSTSEAISAQKRKVQDHGRRALSIYVDVLPGRCSFAISNMLCFVGVETMMPIVENRPVKAIKTAFLIKRAKSSNSPVYCLNESIWDINVIAHRITDVRDITCCQPKYYSFLPLPCFDFPAALTALLHDPFFVRIDWHLFVFSHWLDLRTRDITWHNRDRLSHMGLLKSLRAALAKKWTS